MWLLTVTTVFGKSVCFVYALPLVFFYYKLGLCNVQKKSIVVVVTPLLIKYRA